MSSLNRIFWGPYEHMTRKDLTELKIPRFYYHITDEDFGTKTLLHPRANDEHGACRALDEPNIPRICVAPTVSGCLASVIHRKFPVFDVYKTVEKVIAYEPIGVFDAEVTREKWILDSVRFIRVGVYDVEELYNSIVTYPSEVETVRLVRKAIKSYFDRHNLKDKP